jgi:thiamine biosynthesis lipoprotein
MAGLQDLIRRFDAGGPTVTSQADFQSKWNAANTQADPTAYRQGLMTSLDAFNQNQNVQNLYGLNQANSNTFLKDASAGLTPTKVSPAMLDLLLLSKQAYHKSIGAYDITIGPLSLLWRKARKKQEFPTKAVIETARHLMGFNQVQIDSEKAIIFLPKKGMRLDFGGIAKGYIAQWVIDYLKSIGIKEALADAGGDISMSGAPLSSKGWLVGVNVPETADDLLSKKLELTSISVATSGDVYQFIENEGVKYSHIINPKTGYGVSWLRNVTVIAPQGATADWLATACSILPLKEAKKIALENHAQLLISTKQNGKIKFYSTPSFKKYWHPINTNQQ